MTDDRERVQRWAQGDDDAGRALVDAHFDSVFRFFRTKLDRGAEDLTQQVFAACVAQPDRFRGEGSMRSYLLGMARNILFNHYRSQRREAHALEISECSAFELTPSLTSDLAARGEVRLLHDALRRLPLDLQIVIELHYWEDATTAEIAQVVEVPQGTVKTRLLRARRALRDEIERGRAAPGLVRSTLDGLSGWVSELREHFEPRP